MDHIVYATLLHCKFRTSVERQCWNKPVSGGDLCGKHNKDNAAHGRVRGPIPAQKFELFVKHALKSESLEKPSKQWYARHLIWYYASEVVPAVEYLSDLSDEQYE